MILFIVLALAQGFSQNIWDLIIIRFLIGIPLGSDIANGYAYIMESMSKGAPRGWVRGGNSCSASARSSQSSSSPSCI